MHRVTILSITLFCSITFAAEQPTITRVSLTATGGQARGDSSSALCSADGRFVVFKSSADNLKAGGAQVPRLPSIFWRDTKDNSLRDVLAGADLKESRPYQVGRMGHYGSNRKDLVDGAQMHISPDGQTVVVSFDSQLSSQILVWRADGKLQEIPLTFQGASIWRSTISIARDGRSAVVFGSTSEFDKDSGVFWIDLLSRNSEKLLALKSAINGKSVDPTIAPKISDDGKRVVFATSQELSDDDTNNANDVYMFDRDKNSISRVSVTARGVEGDGPSHAPIISGNGRYVAFVSSARNLTGEAMKVQNKDSKFIFVADLNDKSITRAFTKTNGWPVTEPVGFADDRFFFTFRASFNDINQIHILDMSSSAVAARDLVPISLMGTNPNQVREFRVTGVSADGSRVLVQTPIAGVIEHDTNNSMDCFAFNFADLRKDPAPLAASVSNPNRKPNDPGAEVVNQPASPLRVTPWDALNAEIKALGLHPGDQSPQFRLTPDGRHYVYRKPKGLDSWVVVIDGVAGPAFDYEVKVVEGQTPKGLVVGIADDAGRVFLVRQDRNEELIVQSRDGAVKRYSRSTAPLPADGREGVWTVSGDLAFLPGAATPVFQRQDGYRPVGQARLAPRMTRVGEDGPVIGPGAIRYSGDGRHYAIGVGPDDGAVAAEFGLWVDGKPVLAEGVQLQDAAFSPDGKSVLARVKLDGPVIGSRLLLNGVEVYRAADAEWGDIVLSPDGKRWAAEVRKGLSGDPTWFIDGRQVTGGRPLHSPVFSPDSRNVGFLARGSTGREGVVVNGEVVHMCEGSVDNNQVLLLGGAPNRWCFVENRPEGKVLNVSGTVTKQHVGGMPKMSPGGQFVVVAPSGSEQIQVNGAVVKCPFVASDIEFIGGERIRFTATKEYPPYLAPATEYYQCELDLKAAAGQKPPAGK